MPSDRAAGGSPPHYDLGIDLGNTTVAAAVRRLSAEGGTPEDARAVRLGTRRPTVPLVVAILPDGTVAVGEDAEQHAIGYPDRVVRDFRRRIGDPTPLLVAGVGRRAEDLLATVASWVVDRVTEQEAGPPDRIVITHPGAWGPGKKALVETAMRAQALAVDLVAEARAAVAGRAPDAGGTRSTLAVYDLGGGTFQASVLRTAAGGPSALPEAIGPGVELGRLGGDDFDDAVFDHVRTALPDAFTDLDEHDHDVLGQLAAVRRDCTAAKETLSSHTETSVTMPAELGGGIVGIHRSELEELIGPSLDRTVTALEQAVAAAGMTAPDLDEVLLVGGSARIPLVAQLVSERLDRPVVVARDPGTAVAAGAATAARAFAAVPAGDTDLDRAPDAGGIEEPTRPTTGRHARDDQRTAAAPLRPPALSRRGPFLGGDDPDGTFGHYPGHPVGDDRPPVRPAHPKWIAVGAAAGAALLLGGVVVFSWLGRSAAEPIGLSTSAADARSDTAQASPTDDPGLLTSVAATDPATASDQARVRVAAGQGSALPTARFAPTTGPAATAAPTLTASPVTGVSTVSTPRSSGQAGPTGGPSTSPKPAPTSTPVADPTTADA